MRRQVAQTRNIFIIGQDSAEPGIPVEIASCRLQTAGRGSSSPLPAATGDDVGRRRTALRPSRREPATDKAGPPAGRGSSPLPAATGDDIGRRRTAVRPSRREPNTEARETIAPTPGTSSERVSATSTHDRGRGRGCLESTTTAGRRINVSGAAATASPCRGRGRSPAARARGGTTVSAPGRGRGNTSGRGVNPAASTSSRGRGNTSTVRGGVVGGRERLREIARGRGEQRQETGRGQKRKRNETSVGQIPRRRTRQVVNESDSSGEEDEEEGEVIVQRVAERVWSENDEGKVGSNIPSPEVFETLNSDFFQEIEENCKTPYDFFKIFFSDEISELIEEQSKLYGVQKNLHNEVQFVTRDNIHTMVGILLLSGYNALPSRKMYWRQEPDCHNKLVANSMRRDTFDNLMRVLHFADNQMMDPNDKFYKVRPLFDLMNKNFKKVKAPQKIAIDESISKYFGPNSSKQCIRNKPIRFGYKFWVAAASVLVPGFVLHGEPYCGATTKLAKTGLGSGADVVLGLVDKIGLLPGGEVYIDNYFTGMPLLDQLSASGYGGTGTIRHNRTSKAPLPNKKEMQKEERGTIKSVFTDDKILSMWNDNSAVIVASNIHKDTPTVPARRWNKIEKKHTNVDMPNQIAMYNKYMGSVDLFDAALNLYRPKIRSKKWWWSLWIWSLMAMLNNAWRLYQRVVPGCQKTPQLQFTRDLVLQMLKKHGTHRVRPGPALSIKGRKVNDELRFDTTVTHLITKGTSYDRKCEACKPLQKKTCYLCQRCSVPLHADCFVEYHTRPGGGRGRNNTEGRKGRKVRRLTSNRKL